MGKLTRPTAALYARFSSDLQKDRSIEDQFAICRNVAKQNDWPVVAEFADRAKSGATLFDRDGYLEVMAAAKAGRFKVLILESLDRLSRDQEDIAHVYKRLSFYGVDVWTVHEGKATPIHVGIRGLVGSLFLADLGHKVRRGHMGRVREGKFPGAVCYGYQRVLGKPGEREIDPVQAKIVRRIFTEYARGDSPREIALRLTEEGIPTPNGGKHWNHQTFVGGRYARGMIGNPIYVGQILWNTHHRILNPDTGRRLKRPTAKGEHITVDAPHLRIIEQPLWDAANKVRTDRAIKRFGTGGKIVRRPAGSNSRNSHLLAGLLRCGACGGSMRIAQKSRNGEGRVACAAAHQHGTCQHRKTYDLGVLLEGLTSGMREHCTDGEAIGRLIRGYHAQWAEEERKRPRDDAATIEKRLNRIQVQMDRLISVADAVDRPVEELAKRIGDLETERAGLRDQLRLRQAERPGNLVRLHPAAVEAFVANMKRLHEQLIDGDNSAELRAAFRNVFVAIEVVPTPKRHPYVIEPHVRMGALMGLNVFPKGRSAKEIFAEQGVTYYNTGKPGKAGLQVSEQLLALGRWQIAA